MKKAIQLYSIRDHIKTGDDMLNMLGEVKKLGFDGVEFAGYFGLSAEVLKKRLDELKLKVVGTHMGLSNYLPEKIEETIKFHKIIGCTDIGLGGAPTRPGSILKHTCSVLKDANEIAEKEGMRVYFHNHSEEFKPLMRGTVPMDEIKKACYLELDTYWSACAGIDNYKYITENADRIIHIHLKDGIDHTPKTLGEGDADLATVIKTAKKIGLKWIILENDNPTPTGLEDAARSMEYMKKNI
ncbi:MAG: sugar phosphate isomerase/epimerase [Clostridiales bacterium]|nr:sugar phosphate isomerase/epimerase [Clostridiales bacterium]